MWDAIANPGMAMGEMLLLGALLSCVYDLFRMRREILPLPAIVVFVEDVIYCLFFGVCFFLVLMHVGNGSVRWWLLAACAAGWIGCHFTVGYVLLFVLRLLLYLLRRIAYLLIRRILGPIVWYARKIHAKNSVDRQKKCENTEKI